VDVVNIDKGPNRGGGWRGGGTFLAGDIYSSKRYKNTK